MDFFGRKKEIEKLRKIDERSLDVAQFTVLSGRRRIGKTELVKKAYEDNPRMLYFFVARKTESELCETFTDEIRELFLRGNARVWAIHSPWLLA